MRLQPQGRDLMAGKRTSAESRGTGMGIARVPREKGGGSKLHSPREQWVEDKLILHALKHVLLKRFEEKRLALFSAIAATAQKETVSARGHEVEAIHRIPVSC